MSFFRGATAYEVQVGPLWGRWPYWRFLRTGCWPKINWDREWRH